jgi:TonB family protein
MNAKHAIAFALASLAIAPAHAHQTKKQTIVVTGTPITLDRWVKRTSGQLEQNLHYPAYLMGREPNQGIVRVRFLCSEDGRPSGVAVAQSSGFHELDDAAMRAVRGIRSLHPLPEGLTHDQRYQAVVLFATNQASYDRQVAALRNEARRQLVSTGSASPDIAITVALPAR